MTAQLIIRRDGADAESMPIAAGKRYLVGREAGDVVLRDGLCSSRHAELSFDGSALLVKDLGSTNGTFYGGARVQEQTLQHGEAITIGKASIELSLPENMTAGGTLIAMPAVTRELERSSTPLANAPAVVVPARVLPAKAPARTASASGAGMPPWMKIVFAAGGGAAALLVLIVVWALSRQSGDDGLRNEGEATVTAVWFRKLPGPKFEGGTSPVVVRIARNTTTKVSVGVMEEFSGGTGNMWRAAAWVAAFNASRAAGVGLGDHEYLVRSGGHIDGPSAGMLTTATMLALLRGDRLDPEATMTGTINPDGTAGPVGGIVQKMEGAKADGIKRFGYPIGLRSHLDLSTGATVDLQDHATSLGIEAKEIADLPAAYAFLTGKVLPVTAPIDEAEMQLDAETNQRLRAKILAWKGRINADVAQVRDRTRKVPGAGEMQSTFAEIDKLRESADRLEGSDLPAGALADYVAAAVLLYATREGLAMLDNTARLDLVGIKAQLDSLKAGNAAVLAFGDELDIAARRSTVGGHVNLTRAAMAYAQARAMAEIADDNYDAAIAVLSKATDRASARAAIQAGVWNIIYPVFFYSAAATMLDLARDERDLAADEGKAVASNEALLLRDAAGFGSAAGATMAYFDALVIEPSAAQGIDPERARALFSQQELGYGIAQREVFMAERPPPSIQNTNSANLLRMAAGIDAFLTAATLVNTYYSLGAKRGDEGLTLEHRKALSAQLDAARINARRAAARAKEHAGFVPVAARVAYQVAGVRREGDDEQKVEALRRYWESAQWSELAEHLATPAH